MPFPERKQLIEFLKDKKSYEHAPEVVKHVQTHASDVFIVPPYVYKVKKPVNLGFLDFSTLQKRKYFCEREIKLNSRLCEDTYLSVEEIYEKAGLCSFEGDGEVVEYAVKMRQLDERHFLKNLLKEGKAGKDEFRRVVDKLVSFYRSQEVTDEIKNNGKPGNVMASVDDNVKTSSNFVGRTISSPTYHAIDKFNQKFFSEKQELLNSRVREGFIKDCHGDLHLEHINICPDSVCIYDCIEFNDSFRHIDIASDIAFLSMDLDFRGYPDLADYVVYEVSERMSDSSMYNILDMYKCYRAFVRGKVESIKSGEEEVPENEKVESAETAEKYFRLALKYALFGSRPCVIVVFGVIGTGKSTVAGMISNELGANVYSSDRTRKEITGRKPTERDRQGFDKGIYSSDITEKTYTEIINRGFDNLGYRGVSVIDATFSKKKYRKQALEEAKKTDTQCFFIETTIPDEIIKKRLIDREKEGTSVSDAGVDLLDRFRKGYEKPEELDDSIYIKVDTTNGDKDEILLNIFNGIVELNT